MSSDVDHARVLDLVDVGCDNATSGFPGENVRDKAIISCGKAKLGGHTNSRQNDLRVEIFPAGFGFRRVGDEARKGGSQRLRYQLRLPLLFGDESGNL